MPKETFHRLAPAKKQRIIDAFLREFAIKSYDDASLSSVVKQLGIAKGSVYQYFENKQDLFLFLAMESSKVKMQYVDSVKRENFTDYWTYLRALYEAGLSFDREHPTESHFLHSIEKNINSPSIKELHDMWLKQTVEAFVQMVQHEVDLGLFRNDIDVKQMGFFLYKSLLSINDSMKYFYHIDVEKSIAKKEPIYGHGKDQQYLETVDEYIALLKKTFDK